MTAITAVNGFDVLERLSEAGYRLTVGPEPTEPGKHPRARFEVMGREKPPPDLLELIEGHRDALKAAALLTDTPAWLEKLFDYYRSGHKTPVRHSGPSGKTEIYVVTVSIKNVAAAVAAEIGMDPLEWEAIREEVEGALGMWEGPS